jgi:hypothetical protein
MSGTTWIVPNVSRSPEWVLHLSPVPEYSMNLQVGACQTRLDLSTLKVRNLKLSTGASDSTITFGASGPDAQADLSFGAASVTVRVPRSVGVRVRMSTGLVGNNLAHVGFTKDGEIWTSAGYGDKTSHLEVRSSGGVSNLDFEWLD